MVVNQDGSFVHVTSRRVVGESEGTTVILLIQTGFCALLRVSGMADQAPVVS